MTDIFDELERALQCQRNGAFSDATKILRGVLDIAPDHPDANHLMGQCLQALGDLDAAQAAIEKSIAARPAVAMFKNSAGVVAVARGQIEKGVDYYRQALALEPEYASACNNLGIALQKMGYVDQALIAYQRAIEIEPANVSATVNLGNSLLELGRAEEAIDQYRQALFHASNVPEIHNNLGNALKLRQRFAEAIESYERAIALRADYADAYFNKGMTQARRGDTEGAKDSLERAVEINADPRYRLTLAGLMPVVPATREETEKWRKHFMTSVTSLYSEAEDLPKVPLGGSVMDFYLAYHGENDRDILMLLAQLYRKMFPELVWETPHRYPGPGDEGERRIRVGFFSTFLRNHAVAWTVRGLLEQLPASVFDVSVYTTFSSDGPVMPEIENAVERVVTLPKSLDRARRIIADNRLDVLVYADIGMEEQSYRLAHARLAPVQCAIWGHPVTTGIPTIDCFLSNDMAEPEGAKAQYSERLVRLGGVQTCYRRPTIPALDAAAPIPGVPDGATVYLCPQSLFKIHPDMDPALRDILRRDPHGVLVLFAGTDELLTKRMSDRLSRQFGSDMSRVVILPRTTVDRFLEVVVRSDVILDTWPFGSGNTSYQAFAAGKPVVTYPGAYLRGRGVLAHYQHMQLSECIARSAEDYTDIAIRLGTDRDFYRRMTEAIAERSPVLFDDTRSAEDFAAFLKEAVA